MFGFSAPTFPGSEYVPALFGCAVCCYDGLVFVKGGLQELRDSARPERPARRAANHRTQPGQPSKDDAEPLVGCRLQHRRNSVGRRRPGGARESATAWFAAVLMSASPVIVAINAQLLRRARL